MANNPIHLLMSYIGNIGSLISGIDLEEILEKAFGGAAKMITVKKFPQCVKALRMLG